MVRVSVVVQQIGLKPCTFLADATRVAGLWITLAGCHGCHRYFTENPVAFHDFLREYCGDGHDYPARSPTAS